MPVIYFGSDHAGFELKEDLKNYIGEMGYQVNDLGCHNTDSVDYPDYAKTVAREVANGDGNAFGILVCGTGIGMSIAANKIKGIRAALCPKEYDAQMARNHNNANIICLGARTLQPEVARRVVMTFLRSEFEGGRHGRRVDKINALDG